MMNTRFAPLLPVGRWASMPRQLGMRPFRLPTPLRKPRRTHKSGFDRAINLQPLLGQNSSMSDEHGRAVVEAKHVGVRAPSQHEYMATICASMPARAVACQSPNPELRANP